MKRLVSRTQDTLSNSPPQAEQFNLLALWNLLLSDLEVNGDPVEFPDLAQKLLAFEAPEMLVARVEATIAEEPGDVVAAVGDLLDLELNEIAVQVLLSPNWDIVTHEVTEIEMRHPEAGAQLEARLIEADSIDSALEEVIDEDEISSRATFDWDDLPATAALIDGDDTTGALIIVQLPEDGSWLVLRFEAERSAPPAVWADWVLVTSQVYLNQQPLSAETITATFTILNQMELEPTEAP